MEILNIMPIVPKMDVWTEIIHTLLSEVNEVEVPEEATPKGLLWNNLEDFCTSRVQSKCAEEMLLGKPWLHDHIYYFRLKDFIAFLDRQKFRLVEFSHIAMYMSEWKLGRKFWNLKGKGTNTYFVPEKMFQKQQTGFDEIKLPKPENIIT
jgi:hypothetical protein